MDFTHIVKEMNKSKQKPILMKVNKEWYEQQLQQNFVLRKPNENPLETFTGVKVEYDDTLSTFSFVYED
jgi:hypothetical protein